MIPKVITVSLDHSSIFYSSVITTLGNISLQQVQGTSDPQVLHLKSCALFVVYDGADTSFSLAAHCLSACVTTGSEWCCQTQVVLCRKMFPCPWLHCVLGTPGERQMLFSRSQWLPPACCQTVLA